MQIRTYNGESFFFTAHALGYCERRGFTTNEVENAIRTSTWEGSDRERLECRKDYPYNALWNRVKYTTKQIRPIFVVEGGEIIIITVYTYYFQSQ